MNTTHFLKLGKLYGPIIGYHCTCEQVGREFGWSTALADYYCNVALGKVIHRLQQATKEKPLAKSPN